MDKENELYIDNPEMRQAAVLIPFLEKEGELYLVFTKRSSRVTHHKGQISFPGGSYELQDESLWETAVRETNEELGIRSSQILFLEELPMVHTPTLFEVTPYVAFIVGDISFRPDPNEVEEVFLVPVSHLTNLNHLRFEEHEYLGQTYKVPYFNYENYEIWGVTGRILLSCLNRWH